MRWRKAGPAVLSLLTVALACCGGASPTAPSDSTLAASKPAASTADLAAAPARKAHAAMVASAEFQQPLSYDDLGASAFDALLLPGGHAPGMRPYLESADLQRVVASFFDTDRPVGDRVGRRPSRCSDCHIQSVSLGSNPVV